MEGRKDVREEGWKGEWMERWQGEMSGRINR